MLQHQRLLLLHRPEIGEERESGSERGERKSQQEGEEDKKERERTRRDKEIVLGCEGKEKRK